MDTAAILWGSVLGLCPGHYIHTILSQAADYYEPAAESCRAYHLAALFDYSDSAVNADYVCPAKGGPGCVSTDPLWRAERWRICRANHECAACMGSSFDEPFGNRKR